MTVEAGAAGPRVGRGWMPPSVSRLAAFASLLVQLSSPYGGWFTAIPRGRRCGVALRAESADLSDCGAMADAARGLGPPSS
jgi:hypothetical protein